MDRWLNSVAGGRSQKAESLSSWLFHHQPHDHSELHLPRTTDSSQKGMCVLQTQILQCVAMNVTLIYALLAYCSMKQKANDSFYVRKITV